MEEADYNFSITLKNEEIKAKRNQSTAWNCNCSRFMQTYISIVLVLDEIQICNFDRLWYISIGVYLG